MQNTYFMLCFSLRISVFACFNSFFSFKAWSKIIQFRFCFIGKLNVKSILKVSISQVWESVWEFNNSDYNWWCIRLFSLIVIVERIDKIVKKVSRVKNLAYIKGIWMNFFLKILCRLLKYYFMRS